MPVKPVILFGYENSSRGIVLGNSEALRAYASSCDNQPPTSLSSMSLEIPVQKAKLESGVFVCQTVDIFRIEYGES